VLVVDEVDAPEELAHGPRVVATQTLMRDLEAARRLASAALDAAGTHA
jgi:hypothetical protein